MTPTTIGILLFFGLIFLTTYLYGYFEAKYKGDWDASKLIVPSTFVVALLPAIVVDLLTQGMFMNAVYGLGGVDCWGIPAL